MSLTNVKQILIVTGTCVCTVSNQTLVYEYSMAHCSALANLQKSYTLPGASTEIAGRRGALIDRVQDVKTVVGSFLAEMHYYNLWSTSVMIK